MKLLITLAILLFTSSLPLTVVANQCESLFADANLKTTSELTEQEHESLRSIAEGQVSAERLSSNDPQRMHLAKDIIYQRNEFYKAMSDTDNARKLYQEYVNEARIQGGLVVKANLSERNERERQRALQAKKQNEYLEEQLVLSYLSKYGLSTPLDIFEYFNTQVKKEVSISDQGVAEFSAVIKHIQGEDFRSSLYYPLLLSSARFSNASILKILLADSRVDVNVKNANGSTALYWAVAENHKEIVEMLLRHPNLDVNVKDGDGDTALYRAVYKNHKEIVEMLLRHPNIDVNVKDSDGNTALYRAVYKNRKEIVEMLLRHPNLDVNVKDDSGSTALNWASYENHKEIVEMLLRHPNLDVNAKNASGITALYRASYRNHKEIVEMLLRHPNLDVNVKNENGSTALKRAVSNNHQEIVEMLLRHPNIDVNVKDDIGSTALNWAISKNHKEIVKLIKNKKSEIRREKAREFIQKIPILRGFLKGESQE